MKPEEILSRIPAVIYTAVAEVEGGRVKLKKLNFVSESITRMTGWSTGEITSDPDWWFSNVHEDDRERAYFECEKLKYGADTITRTYRFRKKNGDYIYVLDSLSVVDVKGNLLEVVGVWEDITFHRQYYEFFDAVDKSPAVGVIIYRDKIVYANEVAIKLFNYPPEELYSMNVHDLVTEDFRDFTYQTIQRRLRGEQFERVYVDLPVVTKEGYIREVSVFTRTIQWEGKPAGFVLFFDVTKRKKYERLFGILKDLNEIMISTIERDVLYERICQILVEKASFRMAWIGEVDSGSGNIVPVAVSGYDRGYVQAVRISLDPDLPEGRGPTATAVREGKVVVNPDTRINPAIEPWREEMLKRGYLSSCAIPIKMGGETVAVLNIYSSYPYLFTDEELEVLKEIQQDISFALERIENERYTRIISTAVDRGHEWVVITDQNGEILFVNRAVEDISGYSADELIGKNPRIFKSGFHDRSFYRDLWNTLKRGETFKAVFVNRKKTGELFYLDQSIIPVKFQGGDIRYVALGKDITSEKRLEETVARIRFLDVITELPNRSGFLSTVQTTLDRESKENHIMFLIDIRDFSGINQVYGTDAGDELLKKLSSHIKQSLFKRDIIGRIGADEFGIFSRGIEERDATLILEKILEAITKPLRVKRKNIRVGVNIGAALYPRDGWTAKELFEKASLALSFARQEGENAYRFFSSEINNMVTDYLERREALERAIAQDRFFLHFQPFYFTDSGKVAGLEALLRLRDDNGEVKTPGDFIYVLERAGLIGEVENRVLYKIRDFIKSTRGKIPVAFNVSPKSFRSADFIEKVLDVAKGVGKNLIIEITERLLVENPQYTKEFLEKVRSAGVKVTVDDFGTGYSSLAYLESLPVDILKIDMEFVRKMVSNPKSFVIVETVISLARKLRMKTIAEGVEKKEQLEMLKGLGCDMVQGYYLSTPMDQDKVIKLLL